MPVIDFIVFFLGGVVWGVIVLPQRTDSWVIVPTSDCRAGAFRPNPANGSGTEVQIPCQSSASQCLPAVRRGVITLISLRIYA